MTKNLEQDDKTAETDSYICYDQALPAGKHYQGKAETWRLEQINSRLRHWLARLTVFGVA